MFKKRHSLRNVRSQCIPNETEAFIEFDSNNKIKDIKFYCLGCRKWIDPRDCTLGDKPINTMKDLRTTTVICKDCGHIFSQRNSLILRELHPEDYINN